MSCSLCGGEIKKGKSKVCHLCKDKLHEGATHAQETAYLARWLHTRVDEFGNVREGLTILESRQTRRLLKLAKRTHVDWRNPPEAAKYDGKVVAAREGLNLGRGRPKKAS